MPSTDELAFLHAIAEEPVVDVHYLVLADWLDEHDEPSRADAIRRGVQNPKRFTFGEGGMAQLAYTNHARPDLHYHIAVSLAAGYPGVKWTSYKGLLESLTCTWETWLRLSDTLLARYWFPGVVITDHPDIVAHGIMTLPGARLRPSRPNLFGIPGRTPHFVAVGEDSVTTVLRREWPAVKRWIYPKPIGRHATTSLLMGGGIPIPQIGDVVKLQDGTQGLLMADVYENGMALVRPLELAETAKS